MQPEIAASLLCHDELFMIAEKVDLILIKGNIRLSAWFQLAF